MGSTTEPPPPPQQPPPPLCKGRHHSHSHSTQHIQQQDVSLHFLRQVGLLVNLDINIFFGGNFIHRNCFLYCGLGGKPNRKQ